MIDIKSKVNINDKTFSRNKNVLGVLNNKKKALLFCKNKKKIDSKEERERERGKGKASFIVVNH